ncbi:MAG: glycosyl transferase [Patescibacteria group bacterium]|nr:MAG: glycosyl transferase [Patescibacteria group bacterium]
MKQAPFFSIVIPTLNEEKYLPLLLEDLVKQTYQDFEIIHVDGNSDDQTLKKVAPFKDKLNIQTLQTTTRNVSFQRNMGIEKAKGNWLLFMDADNRLPAYFLDGIRYRLAKYPETELFTTWVSIDNEKSLNQPIERTINFGLEFGRVVGKEWSLGAFIGVKRSIVTKEYWFDQTQKVGEDGIFVKKLIDNGYIFNIFRDPKYVFSVRRLDSEGTIKMARTGARLAINYLQGKDFSEQDFGYKMEGGGAYTDQAFFDYYDLQKFIKTATKNQIDQAKKLFKTLTKIEF